MRIVRRVKHDDGTRITAPNRNLISACRYPATYPTYNCFENREILSQICGKKNQKFLQDKTGFYL